jgi:WD40 repeat protein
MAHFLSDVTHCRLELRTEQERSSVVPISGITHTHDYSGQIRCFAVVPSAQRDSSGTSSLVTWSGELDGRIVVREGVDGKPARVVSEQQGKTFIFALLFAEPYVWAGYSDGYIRFFDAERQTHASEIPLRKAHSAAITGLLLHKHFVFSCSVDWMIIQWDAATLSPVPHCQLSGHSNAVRCIVADGNRLYSGGDDFTIRCWDLDTGTERGSPWPVVMHRDSVRSLAVHQVFLFSASNDGTLCAWNIQTAQLVRQLDARDCPINSLFLDVSSLRLWSSAQDGVISVWDVKTMTLLGVRDEHINTNVPLVAPVTRVNSVKSWALAENGSVHVWYSDSDAGTTEFEQLGSMEERLQEQVEQYRQRIIDNYKSLEICKAELVELERRDRRKKALLAATFAGIQSKSLIQNAFNNALRWRNSQKFLHSRSAVATITGNRLNFKLLWDCFVRWGLHAKGSRELSLKHSLQRHLAKTERSILVKAYLSKMMIAARVQQRRRWLEHVSCSLQRQTTTCCLVPFFGKWLRFQRLRHGKAKEELFSLSNTNAVQRMMLSSYWYKLLSANVSSRSDCRTKESVDSLEKASSLILARSAFRKLMTFREDRFQCRVRARSCAFLALQNARRKLAEVFHLWALLPHRRSREDATRQLESQRQRIDDISAILKENESTTEQQLEAQVRERQLLLARILAENAELDEEASALEQEKRLLQRELMRDVSIDTAAPPQQQLSEAIMYLKARGVNSFHDLQHIQAAREEAKTAGAEAVLKGGIETIRKVFGRVIRPSKLRDPGCLDWYVGELFSKIKRKSVERASIGLCKMVTAFDMINPVSMNAWVAVGPEGNKCWDTKHAYNTEILSNLGPLLALAIRSYRYRRNEDPETGIPIVPVAKPKKKFLLGKKKVEGVKIVRKKMPTTVQQPHAASKKKVPVGEQKKRRKLKKKKTKKNEKPEVNLNSETFQTPIEPGSDVVVVAASDAARETQQPIAPADPAPGSDDLPPSSVALDEGEQGAAETRERPELEEF